MVYYPKEIEYGHKYQDKIYEYRHVILTKDLKSKLTGKLLSEEEWRNLGVVQSKGWEHYLIYQKEPHVLLFRRPLGTDPLTGEVPDHIKELVEEWERLKDDYV